MRHLIIILFPLTLFAEVVTTTNLISQDFTDGSWDNPVNSWHSPNDLAGWNGLTHSTSVVYENDALKSGFDMTAGAEIFHWYSNQTVHITQSVTLDDGSVTSQTKSYLASRGTVHDVANTIVIGSNTSADYKLGMSILFEDTRGQVGHYSADVRDPYITLTYDNTPPVQLSDTQVQEINEISSLFEDTKKEIELINIASIEEFTFEVYEEPVIQVFEEIYIEEIAQEEINIGTVNIFKEIPMEVTYEKPQTIETFATEVESFEERIETTESFNQPEENETIVEASNSSGVIERESPPEETSRGNETTSVVEEETRGGNESASGSGEERIVGESNREDSEQNQSVERNTQPEETTSNSEPRTVREESNANTEELVTENDRQDTPDVSIESITKQVESTTMSVNQKLEQINILVAKAMQSPMSIDSYTTINDNIFNEQLKIDGGNLDEYIQKDYKDSIQISDGDQSLFNDIVVQNQIKIDNAKANVVKSQEHLRRIRGY